ncbi:MAG: DNA recombination protein RmuC, partial [Myxococcota bacterium]
MTTTALLFVFGALVLGGALGFWLGARPVGEWRARSQAGEEERKSLDDKYKNNLVELENAKVRASRADELERRLEESRDLNARLQAERAGLEEQKRQLEERRGKLLQEFENTSAKVLGAAQERLLAAAAERMGHAEKASEEKLKSLLEPVGQRLKAYEDQVSALEAKRIDAFGQLTGLLEAMKTGQEEVRREAQRLGNSLTNAPKARGRWGERALQNVLEQCGLSEHTDFDLEHSLDTDEGRLRPDAIVRVPGQKKLVIDAKVSLNAYQAAFEAEDDVERQRQ